MISPWVEYTTPSRWQKLIKLARNRIAALPFHDCIMVQESTSGTARKVMEEVFAKMMGVRPVIKKTKCDLPRRERIAA